MTKTILHLCLLYLLPSLYNSLVAQESYLLKRYLSNLPQPDEALVERHGTKFMNITKGGRQMRAYTFDQKGMMSQKIVKTSYQSEYKDGLKIKETYISKRPRLRPAATNKTYEYGPKFMRIHNFNDDGELLSTMEWEYANDDRKNLLGIFEYKDSSKTKRSDRRYDTDGNHVSTTGFLWSGKMVSYDTLYTHDGSSIEERYSICQSCEGGKKLWTKTIEDEKQLDNGNVQKTRRHTIEGHTTTCIEVLDKSGRMVSFQIVDGEKGGTGTYFYHPDGRPNYIEYKSNTEHYNQVFDYYPNGLLKEIYFLDQLDRQIKSNSTIRVSYDYYQNQWASKLEKIDPMIFFVSTQKPIII